MLSTLPSIRTTHRARWLSGIPAYERAGAGVALAVSLAVTAILLGTSKASLILYDGDSQLPALWRASLWAAQPQDWVLSSPLFLIELCLYGPAALLPLPNPMTLALVSVIGWCALYVSARLLTAAVGVPPRVGVCAAAAIVASPALEAVLEQSPDRNSLELASLLSTATYYSGSVIASLLLLALVARAMREAKPGPGPLVLAAICAVSLTATLSNPLFIAWTVGPLVLIAIVMGAGGTARRASVLVAVALAIGACAGMVARLPFASMLVQDNAAKVRPDLVLQSLRYYSDLAVQRFETPGGPIEATIVALALAISIATTIAAIRSRRAVLILVAAFALASPVIVVVAAVGAGTFAARYIQPIVFFPPLSIAVGFVLWPPRRARRRWTAVVVVAAVVGSGSLISLARTTTMPDMSMECATTWINHRDAPGAGQYWSVRAVKAAIDRPQQLIQTDQFLNGYSWLTNASDFVTRRVFFTITDSESPPFTLDRNPTSTIDCGRYTIDDYGNQPLEIGPPHH